MNQIKVVYPQGRTVVAVPAGSSLTVASTAPCQVFQQVGFPNQPISESLVGTVNGGETTFTPAGGAAATYVLYGGASESQYSVGVGSRTLENAQSQLQGAPGTLNATGTLTAALIATGLVTSTTAAAVAATLDTGAAMDLALPDMQIGESFDWAAIATGANAFTVTASAGHTIVGTAAVATVTSAMFRTRKTAAQTYITYRLAG